MKGREGPATNGDSSERGLAVQTERWMDPS